MLASILQKRPFFAYCRRFVLAIALLAMVATVSAQQASPFSQVIVFGDSLSDDGNIARLTRDQFGVNYPGGDFNYSDGRFTNSSDTTPKSDAFVGVWHEQLARRLLNLPRATNSLDGGTNYAFGGATTKDGTTDRTVIGNPFPFGGGQLAITIDNMGRQVANYLNTGAADGNALFIVWGGGNDLFDDASATNVTVTANNVGSLVTRLATAGARTFLVPNVPPLGDIPEYNGDATKSAELNAASASYRDQLNAVLDATVASLAAQGVNVTIYRLDIFTLFQRLTSDPAGYGFTNVRGSAQGNDVRTNEYLFWDSIHPTTSGHNQIALAAADLLPGGHPAFTGGEALLTNNYAYLAFPNGTPFGYYSYLFYPYIYHVDLGFEYVIPSGDAESGVYLYDFTLGTFFYTSPTLFPYFYNFNAGAFYYYFPDPNRPGHYSSAPRYFVNLTTGEFITSP